MLTGRPVDEPTNQQRPAKGGKLSKNSAAANREKTYFLVQDSQRKIYSASLTNETESSTYGHHQLRARSEPSSDKAIDLAQTILLIIEKGINIHFMEFLEKVSNQQMNNFFFFKMNDLPQDLFGDDLKVANYWHNLPFDQKTK